YKNDTTGFASSWLGNKIAEWQGLKATTSDRVISVFEKLGFSDTPKPMYYYGGL
ncbi:TPA: signal peptide peptidase SppA, partial [Enterococcus faecium]|nr:signal peptide peptidase SppA [Enterococcus faecium]HAZ0866072.1 signal peptide peptidase SppA [Enterococcus faecium]HAZ0927911.1 signal peptide peptidase SppA [Enterococcus faecium]